MARPRNIIRTSRLEVSIPEELHARLKLRFYSETLGKVPYNAIRDYVVALIEANMREHDAAGGHSPRDPSTGVQHAPSA